MNRFFCGPFSLHSFAPWERITEVPLWHSGDTDLPDCAGNQPQTEKLYKTKAGIVGRIEADLNYRLSGKIVEQRRTCGRCGYVQVDFQKLVV